MAYQKQSQSVRKSQSKARTKGEANDNAYIITTGFGYVNYLQERESKKGTFTSCLVRLATGSKTKGTREYRELDVIVSGEQTENLLWKYQDEIADPECNIYFKLRFSDLKPKWFERDGETVAGIDSYLYGIEKIWIDGELEYEYSAEAKDQNSDDDEEQQDERPRKGQSNSRGSNRQSQTGKASSSSRNATGKGSSRSSDSSRSSSRKRNAA